MGWTVFLGIVAGLLLAGMLYQGIGAARDRRRFGAPGTLASVGGHRLHYRCDGAGTPAVILEAGIAASSLTWSRVQPVIARETRVCSYDRAGSGVERGHLERALDRCARHRAASRCSPTRAFRLRMCSSHIRLARSSSAPSRARIRADVAGLVFVDPLHPERMVRPFAESAAHASRRHLPVACGCVARAARSWCGCRWRCSAAARRQRLDSSAACSAVNAAALLEHMVGEVQKLPPEVLPYVQAHWSNPKAFRGMWQHLAAMPSCSADLARGTDAFGDIPVVVLSAGARDPRWMAEDAALASASSKGRHIVSPRSGHWIHLDDPELVITAIHDVIALGRRKP